MSVTQCSQVPEMWPPEPHDTRWPTRWLQPLEPTVQEAQGPFRFTTSKTVLAHKTSPKPNTALKLGKELDSPPLPSPHGARAGSGLYHAGQS